MIYNINLSLEVELIGVSHDQFLRIQNKLVSSFDDNKKLNFKDIDEEFKISLRPYSLSEIETPEIEVIVNDLIPKLVNIKLVG